MYLTSLLGDVRLEEVEELWADFTNKLEELKAGYRENLLKQSIKNNLEVLG